MGRLLDRLQTKDRATRKVVIPLSDKAVQDVTRTEQKLARQSVLGSEEEKRAAQEDADAARAKLREESVVITVQALSPDEWEALQREHPPLPDEVKAAREEYGQFASVPWNGKTFLPAAWHACQVVDEGDEAMSVGEMEVVLKLWGPGEQQALMRAITEVHNASISVEALGE